MSSEKTVVSNGKMKRLGCQLGIAVVMAIVALIDHTVMVSRAAGAVDFSPALAAVPGMLIIIVMVMAGLVMKTLIPLPLPAIAYCVLIACIFTIPGFIPGAETISELLNKVNFMALATPVTACVGLSAAKDLPQLKKAGLPLLVVTIRAIIGSYIGSALIADIVLKLTGVVWGRRCTFRA